MVGAILTQNTAWTNVEKAIRNLKREGKLSIRAIHEMPTRSLTRLIRPSGYFNQKAERLKGLADHMIRRHKGRLKHLFDQDTDELREELLGLKGIGPETADAIMLYAGEHITFVIDAYTLRFAKRYPLPFEPRYETARDYFQKTLPRDLYIYQEFHALLDEVAKTHCRPRPDCGSCPLKGGCRKKGVH
jgi:endonuclease-3 related protein